MFYAADAQWYRTKGSSYKATDKGEFKKVLRRDIGDNETPFRGSLSRSLWVQSLLCRSIYAPEQYSTLV